MNKKKQIKNAETLLALHHDPKLLVLPNIWDPLGARMLEGVGYPAVATASAAVAFSLGYDDGQLITLDAMLDVVKRIASAVNVPLTVDLERGYADAPQDVADNVRRLLDTGAVGVNIEDSTIEGGALFSVDAQCDRIRAIRQMATAVGVPLVVNARIDVFLQGPSAQEADRFAEVVKRAEAYLRAGADCVYPIGMSDFIMIKELRRKTQAPINVYGSVSAPSMRELEAAGIARLSVGPGLIKASLTTMRRVALALREYEDYDTLTDGVMSGVEIKKYVSKEPME